MSLRIHVDPIIADAAFSAALARPRFSRGDFFHEIRKALRNSLEQLLSDQGLKVDTNVSVSSSSHRKSGNVFRLDPIVKYTGLNKDFKQELDLEFCAGYGHYDYSLTAINYIDRGLSELPSLLPFERTEPFSVGNFLISIENTYCDIQIEFGSGVHATGYSFNISNKKQESYVCFFGLWFSKALLTPIIDHHKPVGIQSKDDLDELRIGIISYPVIFIDRRTGQLYTCSCFASYFDVDHDLVRLLPYGNSEPELEEAVRGIREIEGICHLCTGQVPRFEYGSSMYYSAFLQRYLPYHNLVRRRGNTGGTGDDEARRIENDLREQLGYPRIGEKWISETFLFKIVHTLFAGTEVVHHYRGIELEGLELDIWIPELRLGIEYQGEQHYQVIEHWGGDAGLQKRIENDRKKRKLCKTAGYDLVEFRYEESLTDELVAEKLCKYLKKMQDK